MAFEFDYEVDRAGTEDCDRGGLKAENGLEVAVGIVVPVAQVHARASAGMSFHMYALLRGSSDGDARARVQFISCMYVCALRMGSGCVVVQRAGFVWGFSRAR